MEKIPVLYILDTLVEIAGSERNLYETVTRLDRETFRPMVMCFRSGRLAETMRRQGTEVVDLNVRRIYSLKGIVKAVQMYRFMKKRGVRIVVTYHESSDFMGGLVAKVAGVPVVISSRRDMGYSLKKRHVLLYRYVNRLFTRIVTVSEAVKRVVAETQHAMWNRLVTIYNGVELDKYAVDEPCAALRRELDIPDGAPVVGILAAVRPIKGHRYFVEAAAAVRKRYPDARFLVAGWYVHDDCYLELKEQVRRLGLEGSVTFTGGRSDTPELLSIMDVSVFASINEGFSNAVVESMAAGRPVVATTGGGTPEAVVDGETGLLVPPRDADALAGAILAILDDPERAAAMGRRGRERSREVFSIDRMMEQTQQLYERLIVEYENNRRYPLQSGPERVRQGIARTIRHLFSGFLFYSGLLPLWKKAVPGNGGIRILAYHRVCDEPFSVPGMCVSVDNFESQVRYLREHYNVVSLEGAMELLAGRGEIPPNTIVLTFDDGYLDNYTNAFPVLRRYGVPATMFLSVNAIDRDGRLWFDVVVEAFRSTRKEIVDLRACGLEVYPMIDDVNRMRAIVAVIYRAKLYTNGARDAFLSSVLDELGMDATELRTYAPMMKWAHVVEMDGAGISFGSHGMTHTILSNISEAEFEHEISESKRIIREQTGIDVTSFAYPNGSQKDFITTMHTLLRKHGYRVACTLVRGTNDASTNSYYLRRLCVSEGMGTDAFGRFSKSVFEANLAGVFGRRRIGLGALYGRVQRLLTAREATGQ